MKCPNCGTPEQGRVRRCQKCGGAYAEEDLLELGQLEFLLAETAIWPEADVRIMPYADRLAALTARILPLPTQATVEAQPPEAVPKPAVPAPRLEVEPAPVRPSPEPVPFDQWLLSERNIKIGTGRFHHSNLAVLMGVQERLLVWACAARISWSGSAAEITQYRPPWRRMKRR